MPRYLRWTAAITAGISIQIVVQIAVLAIAVGGDRHKQVTLNGAGGALITFAISIVNVIAALAINDWLRTRYPVAPPAVRVPESETVAEPRR